MSEDHDGADRLAGLHQFEASVDFLQLQLVRDQVVDVDLAFHVPVDDLRHVGAAARAAEGRAFPLPAGHQLERPGADLRAGFRHADDDALAPALVAALQRLAHRRGVADAFEAVVGAAIGELHDRIDDVRVVLGVQEVRHAELACHRLARRIHDQYR